MRILRCTLRPLLRLENMERICSVISSMPGGPTIFMLAAGASSSRSMALSFSLPSRNCCLIRFFGGRQQNVENAVFGQLFGFAAHFAHFGLARLFNGNIGQVAND